MSVQPETRGLDGEDARTLAEVTQKVSPFIELGVTGLRRASGYLDEEFLPQLRGRKAVQIYKEMSENDAIVGALLFSIDRLLRNVDWRVEPAGKSADANKAAKLVETCMEDMSESWNDFISEALSMMIYGWSWHEIVYKRRIGPWQQTSATRSKYTDGLYGWRKLPIRAQETWQRWIFDDSGDVRAMVQLAPPIYRQTIIPVQKSLLFRFQHTKNNPEGRSMLRNAYRSWFMKKRLEEYEAIGVERDLAGLPIVKVPADMIRAKPGTEQHKMVEAFKKMVRSVRRDEQEGLIFPQAYDQDTKQPLYSFELLGSGGSRQFSTDTLIQRYEQRILMTVLADFILVGHQQTGSYSLHVDKTGIFRTALNSIAHNIADTLNRYAIPRLFEVNGWKPAELPQIKASDVDAPDINTLAQFMSQMAGLGVQWFPDPDMEKFVRQAARLPELSDDDYERLRVMNRQSEAAQTAESMTRYLQSQATAQQAQVDPMGQMQQQAAAQQGGAKGGAQGQ